MERAIRHRNGTPLICPEDRSRTFAGRTGSIRSNESLENHFNSSTLSTRRIRPRFQSSSTNIHYVIRLNKTSTLRTYWNERSAFGSVNDTPNTLVFVHHLGPRLSGGSVVEARRTKNPQITAIPRRSFRTSNISFSWLRYVDASEAAEELQPRQNHHLQPLPRQPSAR